MVEQQMHSYHLKVEEGVIKALHHSIKKARRPGKTQPRLSEQATGWVI